MLRVSANGRFLVHAGGQPFLYLGDTAWELFHRLCREEAAEYLEDRAAKGFTVIQAVVLAESDGLRVPNVFGDLPLHNEDPAKPNEAYFKHVDWIVERAAAHGLYLGMVPTWGDKWNVKWGKGPVVFTPENARVYGQWLAQRYADAPIIWILGGDRPVENDTQRAIINAMAEGIHAGDGGRSLISFHPQGGQASSQYFHDAPWLDFNMVQSGHTRNTPNWRFIEDDYARAPTKPCMDAEPGYEDHPSAFQLENGYLDDYEVRKALYWAVFAGAHGHTYGCHPIWQFWQSGRQPYSFARRSWRAALDLPGAAQVGYARMLLHSRPLLDRVPDQTLVASEPGEGPYHVRATRSADGRYAFVYLPYYNPVMVDLTRLSGELITAHWFNPRNGTAHRIGTQPRFGQATFEPPGGGPDWVLVLDDAAQGYSAPGTGW